MMGADTLLLCFLAVTRRLAIKYSNFKIMAVSVLKVKNTLLFFTVILFTCLSSICKAQIKTGAEQTDIYLPLLKGKKVGILTNQTGIIEILESGDPISSYQSGCMDHTTIAMEKATYSIVDFLIENKVNIQKIYSPEHGFRGTADAGELIKDGKDTQTGLPIISLYGNSKKPTKEQLQNIDIMVFDLQDVGARFFTYISSLHYLMEACAENNIPILVFDRPNPKGAIVDGPVLDMKNKSFVGMHPIPVLHGMTIGEYAQMINGEKWLKNGAQANLTVIKCSDYSKDMPYSLPVKPSPNLPNDLSVNLYTSLCFFEGTNVSLGRGTEQQFQIYGSPYLKNMSFTFTPNPNVGAKNPMHNGKLCYGEDLSSHEFIEGLSLEWLLKAYTHSENKIDFFNNYFIKLAGTDNLKQQIINGSSEDEIRASWQKDLEKFKEIRKLYLIYEE
jgi:uncharacterized protein YbbC (DUF1343 family)